MKFSRKQLTLILSYLLFFSICVNIYSLSIGKNIGNKNSDKSDIEKYVALLNEKEEEITKLKKEIQSDKSLKSDEEKIDNSKVLSAEIKPEKEVSNVALRFIEYTFNSNPDTYAHKKKNAHNYMTDDIFNVLFSSDGTSEKEMGLRTTVNEAKVYLENETEDEVIVYYHLTREILSIDFKEDSENYVQLKFKTENGIKKVSEIKAINIVGGV